MENNQEEVSTSTLNIAIILVALKDCGMYGGSGDGSFNSQSSGHIVFDIYLLFYYFDIISLIPFPDQ